MTYKRGVKDRPRNYQCTVCDKWFLSKNDLRKHVRVHTDERPYSCDQCKAAFRQMGSLKNHIVSKHTTDVERSEIYICNYCNKSFPIKERLRLHLRVHTGVKPYDCEYCEKKFARGGQLATHLRTHTGARPYKCKICHTAFTCSANLKFHENRHMEIRDYICDICGRSFVRKDALRKHLNCFHGNVKAFRCEICNKDFKGHLPQHLRTHRNDKPHGCATCGARFAQRSQLTVHQRTHSGEKPYRCKVCWKAFAHSTALKLHIRQHTGEKPFPCLLCKSTSFTQLPHLKKHMRCVHKTDKPYLCPKCKGFFKNKVELEGHRKACMRAVKDDTGIMENDDVGPAMPVDKMRFLLAILLKKISEPTKLDELGFNKKLIDDVLVESIRAAKRKPCEDDKMTVAEKLKRNIQILLEWTVPKGYMEKFQTEHRSTEELLEELTSE